MATALTIRHLVNTPAGPVPLSAEGERIPLPGGPDNALSQLCYGPYLKAISDCLCRNACQPLLELLSKHVKRSISPAEIKRVDLISEKHGTLYQVARLNADLDKGAYSLAVNVATYPEQHAFLENEFHLLQHLCDKFYPAFLPTPYLKGEALYRDERLGCMDLQFFVAEWFEDFHEFHLTTQPKEAHPVIQVWNADSTDSVLTREQTRSLYRCAAAILTTYLDERSFEQIYPWHHAAGDFVVRVEQGAIDLRLVTVRDYRCLLAPGPGCENILAAILHFFLNATMRLRLDRLDGTGALAWAGPDSLTGMTEGFLEAWAKKHRSTPHLPSCHEILQVMGAFTREDWLSLVPHVIDDGLVEAGEGEFLRPRAREHVIALCRALREAAAACRRT